MCKRGAVLWFSGGAEETRSGQLHLLSTHQTRPAHHQVPAAAQGKDQDPGWLVYVCSYSESVFLYDPDIKCEKISWNKIKRFHICPVCLFLLPISDTKTSSIDKQHRAAGRKICLILNLFAANQRFKSISGPKSSQSVRVRVETRSDCSLLCSRPFTL